MEEKVVEENGEKYLTVETLRSFGVRQQCLFMSTQNILFLQISVQKTFGFVLPSLNHTFCWTRKSFCRCVMISKLIPRKIRGPYKQWFEKLYNLVQCEQAIICKWRITLLYGKKKRITEPCSACPQFSQPKQKCREFYYRPNPLELRLKKLHLVCFVALKLL